MNYSVSKIFVIVGTIICMVVRGEQVNVESLEVNLTNPESLSSKPVSMQQFVRITIKTKLMEGAIIDGDSAKYCRPCPDYSAIKILAVRHCGEDMALDCLEVYFFP